MVEEKKRDPKVVEELRIIGEDTAEQTVPILNAARGQLMNAASHLGTAVGDLETCCQLLGDQTDLGKMITAMAIKARAISALFGEHNRDMLRQFDRLGDKLTAMGLITEPIKMTPETLSKVSALLDRIEGLQQNEK